MPKDKHDWQRRIELWTADFEASLRWDRTFLERFSLLCTCHIGLVWLRLRRSLAPHREGCTVWCPDCRLDLTRESGVECWEDERGFVNYQCVCGQRSCWDFDLPVPILISIGTSLIGSRP